MKRAETLTVAIVPNDDNSEEALVARSDGYLVFKNPTAEELDGLRRAMQDAANQLQSPISITQFVRGETLDILMPTARHDTPIVEQPPSDQAGDAMARFVAQYAPAMLGLLIHAAMQNGGVLEVSTEEVKSYQHLFAGVDIFVPDDGGNIVLTIHNSNLKLM